MTIGRKLAALFGIAALALAACSGGGQASTAPSDAASAAPSVAASAAASEAPSQAAEPVTLDWWHIATGDPGKADFQAIADAYMAANPNVKINITVLENEAFKAKLAATPPDGYPDLFQSWGGGTMAAQADAGLLQDITAAHRGLEGHRQSGCDEHLQLQGRPVRHPVGHGDDRLLVQQGSVPARPASPPRRRRGTSTSTRSRSCQAAGITPLAIAGKDKWPSMHLWSYLLLRNGGGEALSQMIQTGDWNTDACIRRPARPCWPSTRSSRTRRATPARSTTTRPRPSATARPPWS